MVWTGGSEEVRNARNVFGCRLVALKAKHFDIAGLANGRLG
jgi:hypothetical protein